MGQLFSNDSIDLGTANLMTGNDTTAVKFLDGAQVALVNSDSVTLDRNTKLADITANEGGYTGYARQTITWNGASVADDGTVEAVGVVPEFRPTGNSSINIYGVAVISSDSTKLCLCGPLDAAPAPMENVNSALVVTIRLRPTGDGISVDVS